MRALIHAGMHRTGTTWLQDRLAGGRAALAARGVRYPGREANHQALAWALRRGEAGPQDARRLLLQGAPERPRLSVLSAEDFFTHRDLEWVRRLAQEGPTSVRVYLRRQDDWLNSWYNQHVKWPFDRRLSQAGPEDFLERIDRFHWLDFEATLSRWADALGDDGVEVAVVEPGGVEDVAADFLARLEIDPSALPEGEARANESLPAHALEIARHMGLHDLDAAARIRLNGALRRGLSAHATPARTVFSVARRNEILDRFEAGNAAVARRFLGRETLFRQPRPNPDEPHFEFPEIDRQTLLRDWIAPVMQELARGR
ncbi:MAG: hypothetical protein AAF763_19425 [Pseudomonadota bacterium]